MSSTREGPARRSVTSLNVLSGLACALPFGAGLITVRLGLLGVEHGDYSGISAGAFICAVSAILWTLSFRFSRRKSTQRPGLAACIAGGPLLLIAAIPSAIWLSSHRDSKLPTAYARPSIPGPLWQACAHPLDRQSNLNAEKLSRLIDSGSIGGADLKQALEDRGCIYEFLAADSMAIADYTRALSLDSQDAALFFIRGRTLGNSQRYQEALVDYNSALRLAPGDAETYYRRGHVYEFYFHDHDKALEDYDASIRLEPNNPAAYEDRALVYSNLHRSADAAADKAEARRLRASPLNPIAKKRAAGEWE